MAAASSRIQVETTPTPIVHEDADYQAGHTFIARCDVAAVYYGGADVTPANGYSKGIGQEFGVADTTDLVCVCVDPGNDPAELQVFWVGV